MAFPLLGLIGPAFDLIGKIAGSWLEKKKIEAEGRVKVTQARVNGEIQRATTVTEGDAAYDEQVAEDMGGSWKDEWFVILLSIPAVLCFVGTWGARTVKDGFDALSGTPEWYQYAFLGAIVASFGLKSIIRPMLVKWFGVKDTSQIDPNLVKGDEK